MRLLGYSIFVDRISSSILVRILALSFVRTRDSPVLVFFAYAVVEKDSAVLFIDENQVDDAVLAHLDKDVVVKPYNAFLPHLKDLVKTGLVKADQVNLYSESFRPVWLMISSPCYLGTRRILLSSKHSARCVLVTVFMTLSHAR